MSLLFIADNPLQCMIAMIMKTQMLDEKEADIMITNRSAGGWQRFERLAKQKMFRNVYYIPTVGCHVNGGSGTFKSRMLRLRCMLCGCHRKELQDSPMDYTDIYSLRWDCLTGAVVRAMQKKGQTVSLHIVEEGLGCYSSFFEKDLYGTSKSHFIENVISVIQRRSNPKNLVQDFYFFRPDLVQWKPPAKIKQIAGLGSEVKSDLREAVNAVFDYQSDCEEYCKPVIFFEDCTFQDKGDNSDYAIIEQIANAVGKENFMVKLHPRTQKNRFEGIYQTNLSQGVNWEVIAMNLSSNTPQVFVAISSCSLTTYSLMMDKRFKSILLFKCVEHAENIISPELLKTIEYYAKLYPEYISIPETMEEAIAEIRQSIG